MIRSLAICVAAVIAVSCVDNPSPNAVTEIANSDQPQAPEDVPTVSDNERYDNPVDKKTYVAPGGWNEYQPSVPGMAEELARIHNNGVRLLTAQNETAERTSVDSIAAFIRRAEASAQTALVDVTEEATIIAQFACAPGTHQVQLAYQGNVTQNQLQSIYDSLLKLEPMPVTSGEVSFQLTIQIDPANRE